MLDIKWKLHLKSSPNKVFNLLNTDEGRKMFWAESAFETKGIIHFKFINGWEYKSKILNREPSTVFEIEYFNSVVRFELHNDGTNGTDLILNNYGVSDEEFVEVKAGWLSVLFALKGAIDFNIDLRNHDKQRTWDQLYVEN